jgi:UDP-N-acetylglucosamine acyltransferase
MVESIHSTAIIDSHAQLGDDVSVGPYAIVEPGVTIGNGSVIASHAVIKKDTHLGKDVNVGHFSVVGGDPQQLSFDSSIPSSTEVGDGTRLGEGVTVHRSMYEDGTTIVGRDCFLMGYSHVAHDCKVGDHALLANGALLGGHVTVGEHVFVGGGAGLHQFTRVGNGAMIGGLAEVSADVPPQITVSGRNRACGLNLIGLQRRQVSQEEIRELKDCYRAILMKKGNPALHAKEMLDHSDSPKTSLGLSFVKFFLEGDRGFVRSRSSRKSSF